MGYRTAYAVCVRVRAVLAVAWLRKLDLYVQNKYGRARAATARLYGLRNFLYSTHTENIHFSKSRVQLYAVHEIGTLTSSTNAVAP